MQPDARGTPAVQAAAWDGWPFGLAGLRVQLPGPSIPEVTVPSDAGPPGGAVPPNDPLSTVGLALLAYGLVQLLAKVVDKLPVGGRGGEPPPGAAFGAGDRKRLERVLEQVVSDHERIQRLQEMVREVHEATRWIGEMRGRIDPRDGEPVWQCRARVVMDQLAVNQRLAGQAIDDLREVDAKLTNVLRKLRGLWLRVGRRRMDRG